MENKRRFISFWRAPVYPPPTGERPAELREIELRMRHALVNALEHRETMSQVLAHSQRVAAIATGVGQELGLEDEEIETLRSAAEIHEIGMLGVPSQLLTRRSRLTREELDLVRAHAKLGAEVARAGRDDTTARLIEQQYEDFDALNRNSFNSRELLLTGILRVADVYDAVTTPRPYQLPMLEEEWRELMRNGSGTKFHPAAVIALLRWVDRPD